MNNGILTGYDDRINNSFFSTNRSLTYANYELGKNSTILGSPDSTIPRNYTSSSGKIFNHIGIPYINNGILNYNAEYNQNIDWDNSYVFVVDTASTFTQNPYYVYTNESTAKIPHLVMGFGYRGVENAIVNWGDGQIETSISTAYVNKLYRQHGIYIIQITPIGTNFGTSYNPTIDGRNDFRDGKVVGILSWPKKTTSLMTFQFWSRCDFVPPYLPSGITSISFAQAIGLLKNVELWDVSRLTSISISYNNVFDRDLSNWIFNSGLKSLSFINDSIFNNGGSSGINNWNVSNFTSMSTMFQGCSRFNQPLNNWNTSNVTNMTYMFFNSSVFNTNIGNWDVSKVTTFNNMFANASLFNNGGNPSINGWNTSNCTNMAYMFASSSFNQPIGSWNVSKVQNMTNMFNGAGAFNQDISSWNLAGLNVNTALDAFMTNKNSPTTTYSTTNYDALLIGWNNNKLASANGVANWRTDLRPNFGGAKYTGGGAAAAARAALVSYGWTITDGGVA